MSERIGKLTITNTEIRFPNFEGRPDNYNTEGGRRTFCVLIDPETAPALEEDGWNVKYLRPRDEEEEPRPYLQVDVRYDNYPPKIYMVTSKKKTELKEDDVYILDKAEIENVDVILSGYAWQTTPRRVKAYLQKMYVTIVEDELDTKYSYLDEDDDEDIPF